MKLLLISPPAAVADETELVGEMLAAGLARFHVRKPAWEPAAIADYLARLPARYLPRVVVHGQPALVREFRLGGLHLTAAARAACRRRPLLLPGQTLSTSFHHLAELRAHRRCYDYVFLSPVFDSLSKTDYPAAFSLEALTKALTPLRNRAGYSPQVMALGGVDEHRLAAVRQAGFAGAAVLGAVWQSPDPVVAFSRLQLAAG
ncbi:thiamine phosphate synthase [Hymenobacter psychrophilus]|uniref:Thiamine-phosphate pyrophosphorylase n=1 Tax=Hymenobacter psychrophilus TaxID=651662 RepID=A0A1H3L4C6_9BACT|nr:thiamine phosphate synthase [Hymenobacter psychrophilus]SDY59273.1 thiamine-phosphate pyrophosphorylase [Hymenobacter psychrophilus]